MRVLTVHEVDTVSGRNGVVTAIVTGFITNGLYDAAKAAYAWTQNPDNQGGSAFTDEMGNSYGNSGGWFSSSVGAWEPIYGGGPTGDGGMSGGGGCMKQTYVLQ